MIMKYKASLHNHTEYSDGSFRIEELLDKLARINEVLKEEQEIIIKGLAIVDHDFYPDKTMILKSRDDALKYGIELIFGTEISADNDLVHIVGYEIDASDFSFHRHVIKEQYKRLDAFETTCRNLNHFFYKEGKTINFDRDVGYKTLKKNKDGYITSHGPLRWHYLREAMVERGMAKDIMIANTLIGPGGPCYHQRETINSVMAVERVLKWGGKPVLAHPHRIPEEFRALLIHSLIRAGLVGIEAYTSSYNEPEETNIYVKIAKENNLLVVAGTDLHRKIEDVGEFLLPFEAFQRLKGD
jgi:predicted metal-dependent phosphoesterase TrpH